MSRDTWIRAPKRGHELPSAGESSFEVIDGKLVRKPRNSAMRENFTYWHEQCNRPIDECDCEVGNDR